MENQSRLQIFLRLFFEKETFCSENRPVNGVFLLINLMHQSCLNWEGQTLALYSMKTDELNED